MRFGAAGNRTGVLVVPGWLTEVVRPRPARWPPPEMIRAMLAICVPLAMALALGQRTLGVLPGSSARWPTPAVFT